MIGMFFVEMGVDYHRQGVYKTPPTRTLKPFRVRSLSWMGAPYRSRQSMYIRPGIPFSV